MRKLLVVLGLLINCQSFAYELIGNYCWMQHDFRLIMPASGDPKIDVFYPSLRDAIVAGIHEAKTDFVKEAANNGKTDTLFLRDPKGKLRGKVLITSFVACKRED